MVRLIDADKLDDYKFRSASERMDLSVDYMSGWNDAIYHIEANSPTVDAEPVRHGRWIHTGQKNIYGGVGLKCSECGDNVMIQHIEDELYCRHCGAKMDGERKEE